MKRGRAVAPALPGKLILAGVSLAGLLLIGSCRKSSDSPPRAEEAPGYASQVAFSDLRMSAEENFLGQQVVYLDGNVTNHGSKALRQLNIQLFFHDTLNEVVLREDRKILGERAESLGPGQTRSFQIRFDEIPDSLSRQVPEIKIVSLGTLGGS